MKIKEVKTLIDDGLTYIGYKEKEDEVKVSVNLIIEIRQFLVSKTREWYKEKFPEAFEFNMGTTRKASDYYYSNDGLTYFFDENKSLNRCILYNGKKEIDFDPRIQYSGDFYKKRGKISNEICFGYNYLNEIDHFFTHAINYYLLVSGKEKGDNGCYFNREPGMNEVYNTITKPRLKG